MKKKLHVIRGKRIEDQLVQEDTSVNDLEAKTRQYNPATTKRQNATGPIQVQQMKLSAGQDNTGGMLEVEAVMKSDSGNQYQSIMVFSGVDYQEEDTNDNVTFTGADGQDYHMAPIPLSAQNVKVRCTCLDFRWRFSVQHQNQGTLYGPGPGIYKNKTQREPNNPNNIPGVCKHLLKLGQELKANRMLR